MSFLLQDYAAQYAAKNPGKTALVDGERTLSYGELERQSNQLAHLLIAQGCKPGDRVGIWLSKSIEAIVGMHGVMKAGAAYVPIDPASPVARVEKVVRSCEPRVLLIGPEVLKKAVELVTGQNLTALPRMLWLSDAPCDADQLAVDATAADIASQPDSETGVRATEDDNAHILFTSGSTGDPKGVMIVHRNVVTFTDWANGYFGVNDRDKNSGHSPIFFDLSTYDIYGALKAGAELHFVPPKLNLLPNKLAAFIRDRELTQWFSVPSILNYMAKFDVVAEGDFPKLQRILWCGEVFPTKPLRYWMGKLPHVQFTNLYGPTEATIASSFFTVPEQPADDRDEIPIGAPCGGEDLQVLDDKLVPVADGEIGDLYISGVGLSPGYWRDQEKTAAAFLTQVNSGERIYKTGDLAKRGDDGLYYYLGRADSQIKSRGYRIELGEIETALQSLPSLTESAIVAVPTGGFEGHAICCAYVPENADAVTPGALRKGLSKLVPSYMIPSRWQAFERLPKTANNKIDRKILRAEFSKEDVKEKA